MADTKISNLTALSEAVAADEFVLVDDSVGTTKKITFANLAGGASKAELGYLNGVTSALQTQLDGKQPLDTALTNISALTYASPSFIKLTAEDTYAVRTLAEVKTDLSLNNVDNTTDANKPISTATQTALDTKAPLASPSFTGYVNITETLAGGLKTQVRHINASGNVGTGARLSFRMWDSGSAIQTYGRISTEIDVNTAGSEDGTMRLSVIGGGAFDDILIIDGSTKATTFAGAIIGDLTGNASGSSGSCTGNSATVTNGVYTSSNANALNDITSAGANIEDAVSKRHASGSDTTLGTLVGNIAFDTTARTIGGVQNQFLSTNLPSDENLVAYWSFDEGTGGLASDGSGNQNTGTLTNMEEADWIAGKVGTALNFGGTNEYVNVPDNASLDLASNLSVCFWYKTSDTPAGQRMIQKGAYSNANYYIDLKTTSTYQLNFYDTERRAWNANAGITTNDGNWHFVVFTHNSSGNVILYVDGIERDSSDSLTSGTLQTNAIALKIGGFASFFIGGMDEIRIYEQVLTAKEIYALYKNPAGTKTFDQNLNTKNSPAFSDLLLNGGSIGTNGAGVLAIANGTAPTTSPANEIQMWSADVEAGKAVMNVRNEDGTLFSTWKSGCRAYRATSNQTIGTGAWTKVQFNAENRDYQGEFDSTTNYRFTAKKAGDYLIKSALDVSTLADKTWRLAIYKNGTITTEQYHQSAFTGEFGISVSDIVSLNATDYIEIYILHNNGADKVIYPGDDYAFLSIAKISD